MATLIDYRGLQVVSPDPTGNGGLAIQNNLKQIVDWNPKGVWGQTASPTLSNDNTQEYFPGSLWLRTDTTPSQLFVCKSSATGAASWLPILLNVVQDSSPQLGGDLDVNGHKLTDNTAVTVAVAGNSVTTVTSSSLQVQGNSLLGTTTTPSGATFNSVLGGGATSPVLGAATSDIVSLGAVDKAAGDRRLYIQSEIGSSISVGNDRLNFAASSSAISIAGTDVISIRSGAIGVGIAANSNFAIRAFNNLTNTDNTVGVYSNIVSRTTTNMSNAATGLLGAVNVTVADGVTNSGIAYGIYGQALRNLDATTDNGTLASMYGQVIISGHQQTVAARSPQTTNCFGLWINPNAYTGVITNYYGLYITAASMGAAPATWAANSSYALNGKVQPTISNSRYFVCTTAGTSGGTEPSWNTTVGATTTDGTAVWTTILIPAITNRYGIYQVDPLSLNVFIGGVQAARVGVGTLPAADRCYAGLITKTDTTVYGFNTTAQLAATANTPQAAIGGVGVAECTSNFNYTATTSIVGLYGIAQNRGVTSATVARMMGVTASVNSIAGSTGTVSAANAFFAQSPVVASGTFTVSVGLYISQQKTTNVSTGFGIQQVAAADINFFAGNVGFGAVTNPLYPIEVTSATSGPAICVNRVGSGTGNAQIWSLAVQNTAANDNVAMGCSSSTYTTGGVLAWLGNSQPYIYFPAANGLKIGTTTGANGDIITLSSTAIAFKAALQLGTRITKYNNIATVAGGVPAIYGQGRLTGQTAAVSTVAAYTVGAADASFVINANVLVTASTTHNFTVTCAYTDEGNTSRTLTLAFFNLAGNLVTSIANSAGAFPYQGIPVQIRAKSGTSITIATTGTFTTVTYNVEGYISQLS
jgi:hypothetical protein